MHIILDDGSKYNISIKKSLAGQVYLISADRFMRGFEAQYKSQIPANVKRAISLFWGCTDDVPSIVDAYGAKPAYEKRKHRKRLYGGCHVYFRHAGPLCAQHQRQLR